MNMKPRRPPLHLCEKYFFIRQAEKRKLKELYRTNNSGQVQEKCSLSISASVLHTNMLSD